MVPVKSWVEISGERLAGNFRALQGLLGGASGVEETATALLAVVKANAYGHGIDACAAALVEAGAEWLGVTDAVEGVRVRAALESGIGKHMRREPQVLVMCGTSGLAGEAELVVRQGLKAVVWDRWQIERLAGAARTAGSEKRVGVHLEIDSGMSRQGVAAGAALGRVLERLRSEPEVEVEGVMTHFASTEVAGSEQTAEQKARFEAAMRQVIAAGVRPRWVHVGNSSYLDNEDGSGAVGWLRGVAARAGARSMVRSGLGLYGYTLPVEGDGRSVAKVLPVMTWKTQVIGIFEVEAGARVGYGGTFRAERALRLALLPVGYADGFRRELSGSNARPGGWVMVRGQRAPVVGRVSMNLTTIDVSGIAGVVEGDEVVLLGEGITATDHARLAGTIPYEILCGVRAVV